MNLQEMIDDLVLSFFRRIGSKIIESNGIYEVAIPQKYQDIFKSSHILMTFDENIALERGCELIIPGSMILSRVMNICSNKGPITIKKSKIINNQNKIIRYYFFVIFSGIHTFAKLVHVDVDLDTYGIANLSNNLENHDLSLINGIDPDMITPSYTVALDELKNRMLEIKMTFLDNANTEFQNDFNLFIDKYQTQIRDLDDNINRKEKNLDESGKAAKFRFDTIEEIRELERDKTRLAATLQKKHEISLEYGLIACSVILA